MKPLTCKIVSIVNKIILIKYRFWLYLNSLKLLIIHGPRVLSKVIPLGGHIVSETFLTLMRLIS